ncbi:serine threonine kinase [Fusarium sp. NRRL 52700]|nr:serine threonine kinase [Fusarium sp. NRRL 52700]
MSHRSTSSAPMDQRVDHFRGEVKRVSISGLNGEDQVVSYVPLSALVDYWTEKRVNEILNCAATPIAENPQVIIKRYLQIFSTLVYNDSCDRISWFFQSNPNRLDDHNLPFNAQVFEHTSDWSNSFLEHQWTFCPAEFADRRYHRHTFDSKVILPVTHSGDIRATRIGPDGAILRKYQVNSNSKLIAPNGETVVFKIYEGLEGEERYNAETNVYVKLDKHSDDYIVKHIASFCFPGTHKFIIVLEHAEGGSLTDYLKTKHPPVTPQDNFIFWEQLFKLTESLHILSSIYGQNATYQENLVGIHQDIHPGNILVFPKVGARSQFDVKFKLTDFGLAGMGRVSPSDKRLVTGNRGNREYVALEVFANFPAEDNCDTRISPLADVWSLGALFSDVLIWTIAGEGERDRYRLRRQQEIACHSHLRSAAYDCCFHDGEHRLKSIEDVHKEVLAHKRGSDSLSTLISDIILDHMLVEPRERMKAMQIRMYAARKFAESQKARSPAKFPIIGMFPPVPPTNTITHDPSRPYNSQAPARRRTMPPNNFNGYSLPGWPMMQYPLTVGPEQLVTTPTHQRNQQQNGSSTSMGWVVPVDMVYQMIVEKNRRRFGRLLGVSPSKGDDIMSLPGMQEARSKISEINGRDQIILFDNFKSMDVYKLQAMKTARVISYVAKEADNDGMEVYAASRTFYGPIKCKNSTEVEAAIDRFETVQGTCKLRKCLDNILDRVLRKESFKPTSIYILTDGIWEPGEDQVKFAVNRAIKFLIDHQRPSSAIMFQFVQFGDDQKGKERMRKLDDECKMETEDDNYDVVDHKHCDSHVPSIVIGSISTHYDEMEAMVFDKL